MLSFPVGKASRKFKKGIFAQIIICDAAPQYLPSPFHGEKIMLAFVTVLKQRTVTFYQNRSHQALNKRATLRRCVSQAHFAKMQFEITLIEAVLCICVFVFVFWNPNHFFWPHPSDQMSRRSQDSTDAL